VSEPERTPEEGQGEPVAEPAPPLALPPWRVDPAADYDALWRKLPQVLGFMQFARVIPGYAAQFRGRVPPQFTAQISHDVLEVACPCGETPRLRVNVPVCCVCGRVFCDVGGVVRVAYTEAVVDYEPTTVDEP
jgi:hypothetical protein